MKKSLTIFLVAFMVAIATVHAQTEPASASKGNALKANPLGMILGIGKINYERRLGTSTSAQMGVSYFNYSTDGSSLSGLGLIPEFRFYVGGDAIDGFYLAPFAKYRNFTLEEGDFEGRLNVYGAGAKAGAQWVMGKKENFVIDLAFGAKYQEFNLKVKDGDSDEFDNYSLFEGFSPEIHFAIGFVF